MLFYRFVVDDLKKGKFIEVEYFDEIMIYFFDIVGFIMICVGSILI